MPVTTDSKEKILSKLKAALEKCSPPMVVARNSANGIELIGSKPVPYGSRKQIIPGMFFSSAVIGKNMVSFHFFPIYMDKKPYEAIAPTLLKSLKGKACFNFKKPEEINETELASLLKRGVTAWKKSGYIE